MVELVFKLNSLKMMTLDSVVQILIRGSKPIDLPVKANVILPQVLIENEEIDFGSIPVEGNPAQKEVILINESNIQVDLELRLQYDTFLAKNLNSFANIENGFDYKNQPFLLYSYILNHLPLISTGWNQ